MLIAAKMHVLYQSIYTNAHLATSYSQSRRFTTILPLNLQLFASIVSLLSITVSVPAVDILFLFGSCYKVIIIADLGVTAGAHGALGTLPLIPLLLVQVS